MQPDELAERVRGGDRRALARAITLVESRRPDHRADALVLLDQLLPHTGGAVRVAISGTPGSGKSTLVEVLGLRLCGAEGGGHNVAVLAVDPTSRTSGGSILGDKTRMAELSRHPNAYIRPSPAGTALGGVARRTREALLVCEAAGFDIVMVETVGVGQSETAVADLVDCFVLLAAPAGGDELQGIKRGVMELADVIAVTKADGDLRPAAERAAADYRAAVRLLRPRHAGWQTPVRTVSALSGNGGGGGLDELWALVLDHHATLEASGALAALRAEQDVSWFREELTGQLLDRLTATPGVQRRMASAEASVRSGSTTPARAAAVILDRWLSAGEQA